MMQQEQLRVIESPKGLGLSWQNCAPWAASFDLRVSPYKASVVDANLFPAGWNNLSNNAQIRAAKALADWRRRNFEGQTPHILLLPEEHTRNAGYWSNVKIQMDALGQAGFEVSLGWTMMDPRPEVVSTLEGLDLHPAEVIRDGETLVVGGRRPDAVLLNHDLSGGVPPLLQSDLKLPVFPHPNLGWHRRRKDNFFLQLEKFAMELAPALHLDPWQLSVYTRSVHDLNVDSKQDMNRAVETAQELFELVAEAYKRHGVNEKPKLFFKSASGTYGMAIKVLEKPEDLLSFNSRDRYKLRTGKNRAPIHDYLLQEAVPTCQQVDGSWAETVMMGMAGVPVGGYYRYHGEKGNTANLNSTGMSFVPMGDEIFEVLGGNSVSSAAAWVALRAVTAEVVRDTPGHLLRPGCCA